MFPEVEAFALPAIGFDHSPLLLVSSAKTVRKRRTNFHFEAFWIEDGECRDIVKHAWQSQTCYEVGLRDKLHATCQALKEWSKRKFPNSNIRIIALKNELRSLTNSPSLHQGSNRIKLIKEEIETLWRR